MIKLLPFFIVMGMFICPTAVAQSPNIADYIARVENGESDFVRGELSSLLNRHPNNPGVLYLEALLTTDGSEAVRKYQHIVDTYPQSEWADDALHKVYKFYYAIGLFRTAELKLEQLKTNYPDSRFAGASGVIDNKPAQEAPTQKPVVQTPPAIAETPPPVEIQKQQTPEVQASPVTSSAKFRLQVGAFSTMANANTQKSFFEHHNYPVEVATKISGSRELYVVFVGGYQTIEEARAKGIELKDSFNLDYIVVPR